MLYIQRQDRNQLETIDQFDTRKEAIAALKEYRLADPSAHHYISARCCKAWNHVETEQEYFQRRGI